MSPGGGTDEKPSHAVGTVGPVVRGPGRRAAGFSNGARRHGDRRDGLVVPGAQVVAVNVGTKDTYEATTNAEGYYNIQFVRTGTYEITVTLPASRRSRRPASKSPTTRSCAPTRSCRSAGSPNR